MRLTVNEVEAHLGDQSMLLVDARAPERFEGRTEPIDRAAGHIPGRCQSLLQDQPRRQTGRCSRPARCVSPLAPLLNGRDPSEAVMYCGSGVTACHNLLAMEHAGLPGARLYVGSWSEWSADPSRPTEKGPSTR